MPAAPWPVEVAGVSEQAIMASHVLRYHYPQAEFPYADLTAENGRRGQHDPEHELLDTGILDCRLTRAGGATSRSSSTSTATTARGSELRSRPGWTGLVADLICRPDPIAADPTAFWTR